MRKHVYTQVVLVCTLSTQNEGNERTLPDQDTKGRFDAILERQPATALPRLLLRSQQAERNVKKIPGIR